MDLSDQGLDHRFGKTLEGKAMDDGATIFFHGADRSFDFGNVAVGGASLQRNGGDVVPDAFKCVGRKRSQCKESRWSGAEECVEELRLE